jgi:hypothetical protein
MKSIVHLARRECSYLLLFNRPQKDAAMGHAGHACMASAETRRNSFAVVPLAA